MDGVLTDFAFEERDHEIAILEWPPQYDAAALKEGWNVWATDQGLEIQRYDEVEIFADDDEALAHVHRRAAVGSRLHQIALHLVEGNQ